MTIQFKHKKVKIQFKFTYKYTVIYTIILLIYRTASRLEKLKFSTHYHIPSFYTLTFIFYFRKDKIHSSWSCKKTKDLHIFIHFYLYLFIGIFSWYSNSREIGISPSSWYRIIPKFYISGYIFFYFFFLLSNTFYHHNIASWWWYSCINPFSLFWNNFRNCNFSGLNIIHFAHFMFYAISQTWKFSCCTMWENWMKKYKNLNFISIRLFRTIIYIRLYQPKIKKNYNRHSFMKIEFTSKAIL